MEETPEIQEQKDYVEPVIEKTVKKTKTQSNQTIFNIVFLVGLAILFILFFTQKRQNFLSSAQSGSVNIGFVNSDSLMSKYLLFKDLKLQIEAETLKLSQDIKLREQALKADYLAYQKKVQAGNISYDDAKKTEEQLGLKQQELMKLSEEYSSQISEKEYQMSKQVLDSVTVLIARMNSELNYDYVLGFSQGSGILYASPKHDITDKILETLNKNYLKQKK